MRRDDFVTGIKQAWAALSQQFVNFWHNFARFRMYRYRLLQVNTRFAACFRSTRFTDLNEGDKGKKEDLQICKDLQDLHIKAQDP